MNGICLTNQVRPRMLRYTSWIAEEASFFFSITLFRAWFYKWFPLVSHKGNHLSVLYDKIPVFYALKYPKFTTITFYPSPWRPNSISSWPLAHFNNIFNNVTISGTNMKVSRVKQPIKRRLKVKNCWHHLLYVTPLVSV